MENSKNHTDLHKSNIMRSPSAQLSRSTDGDKSTLCLLPNVKRERHDRLSSINKHSASNYNISKTNMLEPSLCHTGYFLARHKRANNSTNNSNLLALTAILGSIIVMLSNINSVECVDCFKCSSRNGSNPACEDPFHNLNTTRINHPVLPDPIPNVIYHTPCYAGKKGRDGLFPASACIKLTGVFDQTGETLVVRHCALDSGTLTQDTELARMSHCGKFQFEGDLLNGCVLACPEDACNSGQSITESKLLIYPFATVILRALVVLIISHIVKLQSGLS